MPRRLVLAFVLLLPVSALAQATPDRLTEFRQDSVQSPLFYLQVVGSALIDQVSSFPEEWTGGNGFAKRNVARLEQLLLAEAIGHGVAAALNHQVRYDTCQCDGVLPRINHAISRIFVSRRADGRLAPNISRWTATYGSAAIADFWFPASYTKKDIFWGATTALGTAAALNIVREFIK